MSTQYNCVNVTTTSTALPNLPNLHDYDLGDIYANIADEKRIPLADIKPGSRYLWARGIGCIMRVVEITEVNKDGVLVFGAQFRDWRDNFLTTTVIFEKDAVFYPLPDHLAPPPPAHPVLERQNAVCYHTPERNIPETDGKQPGDFSFITDNSTRFYLEDAYDCITELGLWDFLRDNNPPADKGFMFWNHPRLNELGQKLDGGHSGASYGFTMRAMQSLAQSSWPSWVSNYKALDAS